MQGKSGCSLGETTKLSATDVKTLTALKASYADWQGNNGFGRVGIALSDALLTMLCALPPLLAAMLAFMFQILAWLAIFALPIVGVAGIFPPFRKWLTSLLQILLASYFARFAFGVALTMTELAYGIVFSSPFPFGVQILILLVIVVAAVHLIRAVREAGLTTSWSRAMHGSAAGMAGRAGRQAGRFGGAVLAGAAGGTVVAAEERRERRVRRNTVDRPVTREESIEQARPASRPDDAPTVAPRRRRGAGTGVVIAADGTTSEIEAGDEPVPAGRRRGERGSDDGEAPPLRPEENGRPAEGPQVARRPRRVEPADPGAAIPTGTPSGGAVSTAARPAGGNARPTTGSPTTHTTEVTETTVRRRQDIARAPEPTPPTPPPVQPDAPTPRSRRQEDRTRFVDPEL